MSSNNPYSTGIGASPKSGTGGLDDFSSASRSAEDDDWTPNGSYDVAQGSRPANSANPHASGAGSFAADEAVAAQAVRDGLATVEAEGQRGEGRRPSISDYTTDQGFGASGHGRS